MQFIIITKQIYSYPSPIYIISTFSSSSLGGRPNRSYVASRHVQILQLFHIQNLHLDPPAPEPAPLEPPSLDPLAPISQPSTLHPWAILTIHCGHHVPNSHFLDIPTLAIHLIVRLHILSHLPPILTHSHLQNNLVEEN